jgi:hypothetical protein
METEAPDLDEEVNGVASAVSFGPAPMAVLGDEAGISGQDKIAGFLEDEVESLFCEQGRQRSQSGVSESARKVKPTRVDSSFPRISSSRVSNLSTTSILHSWIQVL